jgi:hypothetical protein
MPTKREAIIATMTILAGVVAYRRLLILGLGVWVLIGLFSWGLLSLINGREISIEFFIMGYVSITALAVLLPWELRRMMRKLPKPTLQPATIKGASHA